MICIRHRLMEIKNNPATSILYESSHRIEKTLHELELVFQPDRRLCVCRELTKVHESIKQLKMSEVWNENGLNGRLMSISKESH